MKDIPRKKISAVISMVGRVKVARPFLFVSSMVVICDGQRVSGEEGT